MPNFGLTFVFHILKNHHLSLFAKRMFCKNGFAKGKNESATTAIQEYFLFACYIIAQIFILLTVFQ